VSRLIATTWVDIRTPPTAHALDLFASYAGAVVEVADIPRALHFYTNLLGFERAGATPDGPRLRLGPDHHLMLAERPTPHTYPDSGTHLACGLAPSAYAAALDHLAAAGISVHSYREDRPDEHDANCYCVDPDGNRLQLVATAAPGLLHAAVETHDLEWAEVFYTQVLGGVVEMRVGWHMDDYARAVRWAEGAEDCAPGTRRIDKPYSDDIGGRRLARPNPQCFVAFAPGVVLGLYLATEHHQEPPPDQFVGTPRLAFRVAPGRLAELEDRLRTVRLRCMLPAEATGGPYERHGDALFVRDPGGNFLELIGA
jgi:catechol 2,3-dioxygenase-like lactoylglutathione lyase family enzyme